MPHCLARPSGQHYGLHLLELLDVPQDPTNAGVKTREKRQHARLIERPVSKELRSIDDQIVDVKYA